MDPYYENQLKNYEQGAAQAKKELTAIDKQFKTLNDKLTVSIEKLTAFEGRRDKLAIEHTQLIETREKQNKAYSELVLKCDETKAKSAFAELEQTVSKVTEHDMSITALADTIEALQDEHKRLKAEESELLRAKQEKSQAHNQYLGSALVIKAFDSFDFKQLAEGLKLRGQGLGKLELKEMFEYPLANLSGMNLRQY